MQSSRPCEKIDRSSAFATAFAASCHASPQACGRLAELVFYVDENGCPAAY